MYDYILENLKRQIDFDKILELRIRVDKPAIIVYNNKNIVTNVVYTKNDIYRAFQIMIKRSINSYIDTIKRGFIIGDNGERIGLTGECVEENDKIILIKDISSFCIRFHHNVIVDVDFIKGYLGNSNILVISPPACGKTTFLRSCILYLSKILSKNVFVIDNKCEICCNGNYDLGDSVDYIVCNDKNYAIKLGLTNFSPDVIVCDELNGKEIKCLKLALNCGVNIMCSVHAKSLHDLYYKPYLSSLIKSKMFDIIVVLSKDNGKYQRQFKVINDVC